MPQRLRAAFVCALLVLSLSPPTLATNITLSADPAGTDCDLTVQQAMPFTWYAVVVLENDAAVAGIQGAEWRIEGHDPGWFTMGTPADNNDFPTNPFTEGYNSAFFSCQPGPVVRLFTFQTFPPGPVPPRILRIVPRTMPSDPELPCVQVTLCDAPVFTRICVGSGELWINQTGFCRLPVESATWSGVKRLFD